MVIRRIREHVVAQNWFAVGIDLAIVVAGVFLGTQVNNWNESRVAAAQGRDYRDRLIRELDFNARQYREQLRYYGQVKAHGLAAVAALEGKAASPAQLLIDAYQLSQIDTGQPKSYIYDEMVASGLVPRLGDETIQDIASDYYISAEATNRTVQEVFPYRSIIRQLVPFVIQDEIRETCGDRSVYFGRRIVGVSLPAKCDARFNETEARKSADRIRSTRGMHQEMTRYIASVDEKLDALTLGLTETERFLAAMKRTA